MGKKRKMMKVVEECNELATILVQQINKPHKDFTDKIIEELGDVLFRIERLEKHFDIKLIKDRINFKKVKIIIDKY